MLTAITIAPKTITRPWITGKSRFSTDCTSRAPSPGSWKTTSTITVPLMRNPMLIERTLMRGTSALRMAYLPTILASLNPNDRAAAMCSLSSCSMRLDLRVRISWGARNRPIVSDGRVRLLRTDRTPV